MIVPPAKGRKGSQHRENTPREHWEHAIMLVGIKMALLDLTSYVRRLRRTEKIILSQKSFIKLIV